MSNFVGCSESNAQYIYSIENIHQKRRKRSKINHLSFYLRKLEKEQIKSKASRGKEILRIRTEIYEIENMKSIEKNQLQ